MKTSYTSVAALALMAIVSGSAFAEGSTIDNSSLTNSSQNQNASTLAKGGFIGSADASTGSIIVKGGSSVTNGSTLNNSSNNSGSTTEAKGGFIGSASADTGSIKVSD
jgi:uncharacterized protein with FMN-binding domain